MLVGRTDQTKHCQYAWANEGIKGYDNFHLKTSSKHNQELLNLDMHRRCSENAILCFELEFCKLALLQGEDMGAVSPTSTSQ